MLTEHPDAQLLVLGVEYARFASDFDKVAKAFPSDPEELAREEERLCVEGYRFLREFPQHTAKTWAGVAVQLGAIKNCVRWDQTSLEERAQEAESVSDALVWQIVAALPALLEQLGISVHAGGRLEAGAEAV